MLHAFERCAVSQSKWNRHFQLINRLNQTDNVDCVGWNSGAHHLPIRLCVFDLKFVWNKRKISNGLPLVCVCCPILRLLLSLPLYSLLSVQHRKWILIEKPPYDVHLSLCRHPVCAYECSCFSLSLSPSLLYYCYYTFG